MMEREKNPFFFQKYVCLALAICMFTCVRVYRYKDTFGASSLKIGIYRQLNKYIIIDIINIKYKTYDYIFNITNTNLYIK